MSLRKVSVSFLSINDPIRKKVVCLPIEGTESDLLSLKFQLHKEMLLDNSILDLGGTLLTPISDIIIYIFDTDFEEEMEMSSTTKLQNLQKNLIVRLRGEIKNDR